MTHLEYYVEVEDSVDYHEGARDVRQEAAQAEADHPNAKLDVCGVYREK